MKGAVLFFGLSLSLLAGGFFQTKPDICLKDVSKSCTQDINLVKKLQLTLNSDKKLHIKLKTDGKLGKNTVKAIKLFQKAHKLKVDGWVGKGTKVVLDRVYKRVKNPKLAKKHKKLKKHRKYRSYREFITYVNLKKSYAVYKDKKLLKIANRRNTRIKIDVSLQRLWLYVNGKVALCTPCTTGARRKFEPNTKIYRDKHTPYGTFRIREKIANKRSTIFGDYYRGRKRVYHGDRRKFRGSTKGLRFVGASLKNWMRLTSNGIGLHASKYIKRYPGTNGCIRLPYHVSKVIFRKVGKGTKVSIVR